MNTYKDIDIKSSNRKKVKENRLSGYLVIAMTPAELAAYIDSAKKSKMNGGCGEYQWKILNGASGVEEIDPLRMLATEALGSTIFDIGCERFARISLECYKDLWNKLAKLVDENKVVVMVAGGNATAFQMGLFGLLEPGSNADLFRYSDMDIKIMIRPGRDFAMIKERVRSVANQVFATHKRRVDRIFYKRRKGDSETNAIFTDAEAAQFVEKYKEKIGVGFTSSLNNDAVRNRCSTRSCLITKSLGVIGRNVKIQVPHLERAENIPLAFTPLLLSVNESIDGMTMMTSTTATADSDTLSRSRNNISNELSSKSERVTSFTLYRLRLVNLSDIPLTSPRANRINLSLTVNDDESVSLVFGAPFEKVVADFIDLSIPDENDTELKEFASRGGFDHKLTCDRCIFGYWMTIPTLRECKFEYQKMLTVYDCPECKRERRELKYAAISKACDEFEKSMAYVPTVAPTITRAPAPVPVHVPVPVPVQRVVPSTHVHVPAGPRATFPKLYFYNEQPPPPPRRQFM